MEKIAARIDLHSGNSDSSRAASFLAQLGPVLLGAALPVCLLLACLTPAVAQTISLDGDWQFVADPQGNRSVASLANAPDARPIRVPGSWQAQFDDLRDYAGAAWYWRSFEVARPSAERAALLHFGAVDYRAEVFFNGQKVGTHDGGYLPFEFDVTSQLRDGKNQVAVRVLDAGARPDEVEGIKYAEIPHGKQNWYVQTSGLWQPVSLEIRPTMRWGTVHISAPASGNFKIDAEIVNPPAAAGAPGSLYAGAEITDAGGKSVWKQTQPLEAGKSQCAFSGTVTHPSLWSPATPALYTLRVWLNSGDSVSTRFGFRTFETRAGKFYLNGKAIYLRGALDQAFYPDTVYTPPSADFLKDEMARAKSLGLNMLRCHIKVPDPRYLDAADQAGVLIWYEIPNWDKLTPDSERRGLETLHGMVERDWNHPSIVMVSIINESWGADLKQASDRAWLKQAYSQAKSFVPGWLVDDNSACCQNFHMKTDVADFHNYNAIPDYAGDFDRWVGDLAHRPGWLFSPENDAQAKGDEPLMVSEFGNWGLPHVPEPAPWWFARDFNGKALTLPAGYDQRFADYGYASLFPNLSALVDATERHEGESLKFEIESIRARPEIQGYVITEFTDVNWESNGLLDLWRHPKVFAEALAKLQQDDVVVARSDQRNFTSGDHFSAELDFSHYNDAPATQGEAQWHVEGTTLGGSLPLPPVATGSGVAVGKIEFTVPEVAAPAARTLQIRVVAAGRMLAENTLEVFFYPRSTEELRPAVSFHDPAGRLRRLITEMRAHEYLAPSGSESLPVLITSTLDDDVKQTLKSGGRVILLANEAMTLAPGLEVVPRAGSDYDGNWISSFFWVRPNVAPFKGTAFGVFQGFESQAATPVAVVKGVPAKDFGDVLAGIFYGWIHSNVGVVVQARAGKGRLLVCTLPLATSYGTDPYATRLLDGLVEKAVSLFTPNYEIPLSGQ